jgi:DtxR family Mn-dependent transcriptional regulator
MEDRIDALLGHPTTDPHGAPIPARDGSLPPGEFRRLVDVPPGESAVVAEVSDHDPALLRYLGEMGLYPRAEVKVVSAAPFEGPLTVRVGKVEHALGREVAGYILVAASETSSTS